MDALLNPVGAREAKNRFSELAAEVNRTGNALPVLKNGKPWVVIQPASEEAQRRRARLEKFYALTSQIERGIAEEPAWDFLRFRSRLAGGRAGEAFWLTSSSIRTSCSTT